MIAKLYKVKDKLVLYLPSDVIGRLGLKEGDDLDFFPYSERAFILAKKSDIAGMLAGMGQQPAGAQARGPARGVAAPTDEELAVLKKLNTVMFKDRTKDRLQQMLNKSEKRIVQDLIKKNIMFAFKKEGEKHFRYGISRETYETFLRGKGTVMQRPQLQAAKNEAESPQKRWEKQLGGGDAYMDLLESNGFLVLANQSEASALSAALEESIRRGIVIGTRAFNKKYYIVLKAFVNKNSQRIVKAMGQKGATVEEMAKETGVGEDGIRAVLYMMAESGDVTEVKRDFFRPV